MNPLLFNLLFAFGYNLVCLIIFVTALFLAGRRTRMAWTVYGLGLGLQILSISGSLSAGQPLSFSMLVSFLLFILFFILIYRRAHKPTPPAPMPGPPPEAPAEALPIRDDFSYCPRCGQKLGPNCSVCPVCGAPIRRED